jgi:hypothetical protein
VLSEPAFDETTRFGHGKWISTMIWACLKIYYPANFDGWSSCLLLNVQFRRYILFVDEPIRRQALPKCVIFHCSIMFHHMVWTCSKPDFLL